MNEQIKPINENITNIKEIKEIKEPKENKSENNSEIITTLPEWSIEPPLKINRGQK